MHSVYSTPYSAWKSLLLAYEMQNDKQPVYLGLYLSVYIYTTSAGVHFTMFNSEHSKA